MLLLALLSCVHAPAGRSSAPPSTALRYHLTGSLTLAQAEGLPPGGVIDLDLTVSAGEVRRFRDGSVGQMIRFEQSGLEILQNQTIELRTFLDGEILAVGLLEHVVGGGLGLDVLDPILPLLSPSPPRLEEGQPTRRAFQWPLRVDTERRWLNRVEATWTNLGLEPVGEGRAWHLRWEGPWRAEGQDGRATPALKAEANGTASGEVWIDAEDLRPLRADFQGERALALTGAASVGQTQRFALSLERSPDPVVGWPSYAELSESLPLPRYLNVADARAVVLGALPSFQACLPAEAPLETEARLSLQILADGAVGLASLSESALSEPVARCVEQVGRGLRFPAHDGPPTPLEWPVVTRAGQVTAHPGVLLGSSEDIPMFFAVQRTVAPETRASLTAALGYASALSGEGAHGPALR